MATQLIRLTLVNGDPEGLRYSLIAGRTTVLFACPWTQLKLLLNREEAKRPAVYFMVGAPLGPERNGYEQAIYIGECDSLIDRFAAKHHRADAAEWNQIFLATTTEGTFNKAHARLAEHKIREKAQIANRAKVLTLASGLVKMDEGDLAFTDEFVGNVTILAQTLGLGLFRTPVSESRIALSDMDKNFKDQNLHLEIADELDIFKFEYTNAEIPAQMILDGPEFVIKKGSYARSQDGDGMPPGILERRKSARVNGILLPSDKVGLEQFNADYPTTSPSAAGSMVYGSSCAGPRAWRHIKSGLLYKDWLLAQSTK
ncbi:hypothetical protein M0638_19900 [Roseomonas sp. NAR14]|uniref:DUF4357 domain-containing protein n=1 Tax=Roseomonas acroporae TaxID=2937791 RepID=A0A9X2BVF9_9PROT|nr:hypothetical protein [Roseomonas acroporae]MCK8786643.1 hypothetical protein [Roseomonas acroporae]